MGNVNIFSWFESTVIAMQHPRRLSVFGWTLKPEAVNGAFQNRQSGLFHSSEWM